MFFSSAAPLHGCAAETSPDTSADKATWQEPGVEQHSGLVLVGIPADEYPPAGTQQVASLDELKASEGLPPGETAGAQYALTSDGLTSDGTVETRYVYLAEAGGVDYVATPGSAEHSFKYGDEHGKTDTMDIADETCAKLLNNTSTAFGAGVIAGMAKASGVLFGAYAFCSALQAK